MIFSKTFGKHSKPKTIYKPKFKMNKAKDIQELKILEENHREWVSEPTKKQKLVQRLIQEWKNVFGEERVFFSVRREYPPSYSPRYKGKRDYSRKTLVVVKHSLEFPRDSKKLKQFKEAIWKIYNKLSFQY